MIAVTFDVDDVAWTIGEPSDEFRDAVPRIASLLTDFAAVRTTWFIRLDAGIARVRGQPDALFVAYHTLLAALRGAGHEIAWHHHAVQPGTPNTPQTDSRAVCRALRDLAPCAKAWGLESVRMGWAYADPAIVSCLDDLGFKVDSTALPRPAYPWDVVPRDWERAPRRPYYPARDDHRGEGRPACALLEVPLSVAEIPADGDTQSNVQRYLNPAYHPAVFARALRQVASASSIVTVTHPYECFPHADNARLDSNAHPLLAHDLAAFRQNLTRLCSLDRPFVTLQQLGARHATIARHDTA